MSLFFIWIEYQGKLILQRRRKEIEDSEGDEKLITQVRLAHKVKLVNFVNQFGIVLFDLINKTHINGLAKDSLHKHHLTNAIIQIVKAGTEVIILDDDNNNRLGVILNFIKYGLNNLQSRSHKTFKGCLTTIEKAKGHEINDLLLELKETDFQRFVKNYIEGDIVDFKITGIKNYGVFGNVDKCMGLMHKSNIPKEYHHALFNNFTLGMIIVVRMEKIDLKNKHFSIKFNKENIVPTKKIYIKMNKSCKYIIK